jgi:hypothetical protein
VILHREGVSRRDDAPGLPRSVPELGRFLRQERSIKGLTVEDVSARTGLPQAMLEAFESGTVDRLPDQVQTVKALRGYAEALGLPGNDYALLLIDLWPSYGGGPPVVVVQGNSVTGVSGPGTVDPVGVAAASGPYEGDTAMVPLATPAAAPVAAAAAAAAAPPTVTRTGPESTVHRVGGTSLPPDAGARPIPMIFADTGVTPAVPSVHRHRRSRTLIAVVAIVVLALLVGVAGLVVHQVKPQWLHDIGIGSSKNPPARTASHRTTPPAPFQLATSSPTSATFIVREPSFVVKVVTVGGGSWIQASDTHHVNPIYSGELAANAQQTFTVNHSLTLQLGSKNARVFVSSGFKTLGFYFPQAAPFTLVFHQEA